MLVDVLVDKIDLQFMVFFSVSVDIVKKLGLSYIVKLNKYKLSLA